MDFTSFNLKHLERPDPLWLHKLGNALFFNAAKTRATREGKPLHEVTELLVRETSYHLRPSVPGVEALKGTPLDPLIDAVTAEARALDEVFHLFSDKKALRDKIAAEIFDVYERTGILQHLHTTGAITAEEFRNGAVLLVKQMDQYGANGLGPALKHWQEHGKDWIAHLEQDTSEFVPSHVRGLSATRPKPIKRGDYFKSELQAIAKMDPSKYREILTNTIGPAYKKTCLDRELLIGTHLISGTLPADYDFWGPIAAKHPAYKRAQEKVKTLKSSELKYVDEGLNITEGEITRIRQGQTPQSFHEALSWISSEKAAEHPNVIHELRETLRAAGVSSTTAEPATAAHSTAPTEAKAPALLGHETSTAQSGKAPPPAGTSATLEHAAESLSRKTGMIKVGSVILGGIFCADQVRRGWKDQPDETGEKHSPMNKILHYAAAAAAATGVVLVVLAKPETIGQLRDRMTGLFKKSPQL
jgi:hypothetical protein